MRFYALVAVSCTSRAGVIWDPDMHQRSFIKLTACAPLIFVATGRGRALELGGARPPKFQGSSAVLCIPNARFWLTFRGDARATEGKEALKRERLEAEIEGRAMAGKGTRGRASTGSSKVDENRRLPGLWERVSQLKKISVFSATKGAPICDGVGARRKGVNQPACRQNLNKNLISPTLSPDAARGPRPADDVNAQNRRIWA